MFVYCAVGKLLLHTPIIYIISNIILLQFCGVHYTFFSFLVSYRGLERQSSDVSGGGEMMRHHDASAVWGGSPAAVRSLRRRSCRRPGDDGDAGDGVLPRRRCRRRCSGGGSLWSCGTAAVVWVPWLLLRRVAVWARNCNRCDGRVVAKLVTIGERAGKNLSVGVRGKTKKRDDVWQTDG